jgi:hypothetical protein
VQKILTSNHFNGRGGYKPRYVINHGTAGGTSAVAIAQYFQSTEGSDEPVSSNYVIGTDGQEVMCVEEVNAAYGNGILEAGHDTWWTPLINPNYPTISIEHCKPSSDNSDPLTDAQKLASFMLIRDICLRNNIPMRPADTVGGITGHFSIAPLSRKSCPGNYPWAELWAYLRSTNTMAIPSGWTDNSTTLTAPNGIIVTLGFRDYIKNNAWNPANVPQRTAEARGPILLSNPSIGSGTRQVFRDCVLIWTPKTNVFMAPLGQELLAYEQALAAIATPSSISTAIGQAATTLAQLQQHLNLATGDLALAQQTLAQLK